MIIFIGVDSLVDNSTKKLIAEAKQYLSSLKFVGFDTETKAWHPVIGDLICYQLGDYDRQYVIDHEIVPIEEFRDILESKTLLIHNAQFDLKFTFHHNIFVPPENIYDTFLAECVIQCGLIYDETKRGMVSLANIGFNRLGIQLDKSIRGQIHKLGLEASVIKYAAEDVQYLERIMESQLKDIETKDLMPTVQLENEAVACLAWMAYRGMDFDAEGWTVNYKTYEAKVLEEKKKLDELVIELNAGAFQPVQTIKHYKTGRKITTGFTYDLFKQEQQPELKTRINWDSPKQVMDVLQQRFGIFVKDSAGDETTNSKILDFYIRKNKKFLQELDDFTPLYITKEELAIEIKATTKFLEILKEFRETAKQVSTYGEKFLNQYRYPDGRIRTTFWQVLNTGRTSAGSKRAQHKSPNTQNIPPKLRQFFVAPEGFKFITLDYSQQEPRLTTDKCKDPALIDFFLNGDGDMHSFVASKLYSALKGEEVVITKDAPYVDYENRKVNGRQIGKTLNLKLDYGGSAYTVKDDLLVSEKEAQVFIDAIMKAFPKKKEYFRREYEATMERGYVLMNKVSRRKSFIPNFESIKHDKDRTILSAIERKSQNYPIQGTGGDMCKKALYLCYNEIMLNYKDRAYIVNFVHDEIDFICEESIAEEFAIKMKALMEEAGNMFCEEVPIIAEYVIDKCWAK